MTSLLRLPLAYLLWHYTAAWADLLRLYFNLSWFLFHFFSLRILLGTLFSPWKRLHASGKEDGGFFGTLILNTITRLVGFLVRSVTILAGLFSLLLLAALFLLAVVVWATMPLLLLGIVFASVKMFLWFL